jgi:hypothetical protein
MAQDRAKKQTSYEVLNAEKPKPVVSYDALHEFAYDNFLLPNCTSKTNKTSYNKTATVNNQALKDWNRGLDIRIIIEVDGKEISKPLFKILAEFSEDQKIKYQCDKSSHFRTIEGLQLFWRDYLFKKVADEESKKQLLKSAEEDFHQGGLPYTSNVKAFGDFILLQTKPDALSIPQAKDRLITYKPTVSGVEITEIAEFNKAYPKQKMQVIDERVIHAPLIRLECQTSLCVIKNDKGPKVEVKPHKLTVDIYTNELKDFVYGRGFLGDYVTAYSSNKSHYHDKEDIKKEMLDSLMGKICDLYKKNTQREKCVSLFYIYMAFKDVNLSDENSIKKCKAVIDRNLKNIENFSSSMGKLGAWVKQSIFSPGRGETMSDTRLLVGNLLDFIENKAFPEERARDKVLGR